MNLSIKDTGPIQNASIELNGVTVITGPNDSGKSFTMKMLDCIAATFHKKTQGNPYLIFNWRIADAVGKIDTSAELKLECDPALIKMNKPTSHSGWHINSSDKLDYRVKYIDMFNPVSCWMDERLSSTESDKYDITEVLNILDDLYDGSWPLDDGSKMAGLSSGVKRILSMKSTLKSFVRKGPGILIIDTIETNLDGDWLSKAIKALILMSK